MASSQRVRVIVLGVFGAVGAFFLFGGFQASRGSKSGEPYDAMPRDSFLVAQLNLAELRRSPLYEVLLGKDSPTKLPKAELPIPGLNGPRGLGIDKLGDACGFDPLSRVETMAIGVPEEGDKGELGLAARVNVTSDELARCTSAMASQHGGKVETKNVGGFAVVDDTSSEAAAKPHLAYGHGNLLVVGRGTWFDAMLASADGKKPSVREAPGHAAMRSSILSKPGWGSPTVLIIALLPRPLRDRIKNEMGAEIDSQDKSQAVMAGVLAVSSIGFALRAGASGGTTDAAFELACDGAGGEGEAACANVEKLILKKRLDWSKELMLRMVGFGPLLDSIEVKRDGARVRVTAGASADTLASTLDRVLRLKAHRDTRDDREGLPPRLRAPAAPSRSSDETIPAPRPSLMFPKTAGSGGTTGENKGPGPAPTESASKP